MTSGACIWLTGLSGAGKSTTARALAARLESHGCRVTLLDGDVVRALLWKGLGFSKADRDLNVERIGFVAAEIVRHGGVAICAAVSPYRAAREAVRASMPDRRFVEVFVDTPIEECERRDAKGLYARARRGELAGLTGVDDPYEAPLEPALVLRPPGRPDEHAGTIFEYLTTHGLVSSGGLSASERG